MDGGATTQLLRLPPSASGEQRTGRRRWQKGVGRWRRRRVVGGGSTCEDCCVVMFECWICYVVRRWKHALHYRASVPYACHPPPWLPASAPRPPPPPPRLHTPFSSPLSPPPLCPPFPISTGAQGLISLRSLRHYAALRQLGVRLVVISGARLATLLGRLPCIPAADAYVCEGGGRIFYPASPADLPTAAPLVEDAQWRATQAAAGPPGQEGVPPERRKGELWQVRADDPQWCLETGARQTGHRLSAPAGALQSWTRAAGAARGKRVVALGQACCCPESLLGTNPKNSLAGGEDNLHPPSASVRQLTNTALQPSAPRRPPAPLLPSLACSSTRSCRRPHLQPASSLTLPRTPPPSGSKGRQRRWRQRSRSCRRG